jgi:protein SCO1/2
VAVRLSVLLAAAALAAPPHFAGTVLSPAPKAPDFALRDQSGHVVRLSALRGKYVLVTFLYTHCPDVCPLIASHLNDALRELGPRASSIRVVAVSTDPKGDTRQGVKRFIRSHRLLPEFRYLTGTARQLEPIWKAWHVVAFPGKDQTVNHSSFVMLVDKTGNQRVFYDATVTGPQVVHDLALLQH